MSKEFVITGEEELKLRQQWEKEVLPKVVINRQAFELVRGVFQRVSEKREEGEAVGQKKRDLAEEHRQRFEKWYRQLGFTITVPKPDVSNREFARRAKLPIPQKLVFRPATKEVPYEAFMIAVGQATHWTVTDQAERAKIIWEPTEIGYWFWAEVPDNCPRTGTCWNDLNQQIKLLCLEEYAIVWHAYKAETGKKLDVRFWCWLRTHYKLNDARLDALCAIGYDGGVRVARDLPEHLGVSYGDRGGRAAEVVKNAA